MSTQPFLGDLMMVSFNFAPRGWALCNGQTLSINNNQALFSLLGTTYGGNGQTTFALPDLRGRVPIHMGQLQGGSFYTLGQKAGTETATLTLNNLPQHTHPLSISSQEATTTSPANNFLAVGGHFTELGPNASMLKPPGTVPAVGGNPAQPFSLIQPVLCINWCIALQGIFPSRN